MDRHLFKHEFIASEAGVELFKWMIEHVEDLNRKQIAKAFKEGWIKVNGRSILPSYTVAYRDKLELDLRTIVDPINVIAQPLELNIIYEDEYLLVVNKPKGQVTHPTLEHRTNTLVNGLLWKYPDLPHLPGEELQPGLAHRIDKDTSGLLVIARKKEVLKYFLQQFYEHNIHRTYWALVWGVPSQPKATIRVPLGRKDAGKRITAPMPLDRGGKNSITHYQIIEKLGYVSLIECRLETGRTHQIRSHMKYMGHPLFNDKLYDGRYPAFGPRQNRSYQDFVYTLLRAESGHTLHARTLGFIHPMSKEKLHFKCPLPNDFEYLCSQWRTYKGTELLSQ